MSLEKCRSQKFADSLEQAQELKIALEIKERLVNFIKRQSFFEDQEANLILQSLLKDCLNLDDLKVGKLQNEETGELLFFATDIQSELDDKDSELNQLLKFILFLKEAITRLPQEIQSLSNKVERLKIYYEEKKAELETQNEEISETDRKELEEAENNYQKNEVRLTKKKNELSLQKYADLLKEINFVSQLQVEGKNNLTNVNLKDAQGELCNLITQTVSYEDYQEKAKCTLEKEKSKNYLLALLKSKRIQMLTFFLLIAFPLVDWGYRAIKKNETSRNKTPISDHYKKITEYREVLEFSKKNLMGQGIDINIDKLEKSVEILEKMQAFYQLSQEKLEFYEELNEKNCCQKHVELAEKSLDLLNKNLEEFNQDKSTDPKEIKNKLNECIKSISSLEADETKIGEHSDSIMVYSQTDEFNQKETTQNIIDPDLSEEEFKNFLSEYASFFESSSPKIFCNNNLIMEKDGVFSQKIGLSYPEDMPEKLPQDCFIEIFLGDEKLAEVPYGAEDFLIQGMLTSHELHKIHFQYSLRGTLKNGKTFGMSGRFKENCCSK